MSWTFKSGITLIPRIKFKQKPVASASSQPSSATPLLEPDWDRLINAIHRRPETRPLVLDILDELDASPDGHT